MKLLNERDGLALGICNGFQALIKLGLVPYGEIRPQAADSPTLTYNTIGRHISKMVYTKVVTDKSPWLAQAELGKVYCNPASHGEGRFVAPKEWCSDHGRRVERQWFLLFHRGYHKPGWTCARQDGSFRET